ncbi:hypothetical protein QN277_022522 [Acacia crassicarpa]|uniref:Thioesterase domain-containing protein n=1 Tax=Acacia crassicarpa TaxID=499986 RepID=A0AAE1JI12_9FABA|nr:hypothetical protein QN277_022522 [Acacia crassicarpa]
MEESKAELERLEKWIRRLSKGEAGNEVGVEANKGVTLVKLDKGFVLCDFIVHNGVVSDESGKWHEGAMMTLMDGISSWVAFSLTSLHHITVSLSVSFYSKPYLQEVVEIEAKATGKKGRMTSVTVEVRNKHHRQPLALGVIWMAPASPSNNNKPFPSKL